MNVDSGWSIWYGVIYFIFCINLKGVPFEFSPNDLIIIQSSGDSSSSRMVDWFCCRKHISEVYKNIWIETKVKIPIHLY